MDNTHRSKPTSHIYGPVPSRRLGYSLGVDILPFKTCTLDCIYCQLGRSSQKDIKRKSYFCPDEILDQIKEAVEPGQRIDYITFSGSGEPTLNTILGPLIREIKKLTNIPVAVLTNSSLLMKAEVREALKKADLVVPSLDAVTQDIFTRINRPHVSLNVKDMIQGLQVFRQEFSGKMWLEVMLVKGLNDSPELIQKLKETIALIKPHKVQLNTVVRPPAEGFAQPLDQERMEEIRGQLGDIAEIVVDFPKQEQNPRDKNIQKTILAYLKRRPATLADLTTSLGIHNNEVIKYLDRLRKDGKIRVVHHTDQKYYEPY
ncbi:MAG: radical SAM protein [Candidatus Aminicenantes bacterium]|nr:radical SAM protein [Candidatus Aminicenantes bacterium]